MGPMSLLKVNLLVESKEHEKNEEVDKYLSEIQLREKYKPVYITSCLVKEHIMEFHPNLQFPYETLVTMVGDDVYSVNMEYEEFIKLYGH